MPHCIIEHASKIDGKTLMSLVFEAALASQLFEVDGSDIKVRALPYDDFITGNSALNFIHVTLKILSGRSTEQKLMLSNLVLEKLKSHGIKGCAISVEIVDIARATYVKGSHLSADNKV